MKLRTVLVLVVAVSFSLLASVGRCEDFAEPEYNSVEDAKLDSPTLEKDEDL